MTMSAVRDDSEIRGRQTELELRLNQLENAEVAPGGHEAVAMLIADAALAGDDAALARAEHLLKRLYSRRVAANVRAEDAERELGWITALNDVVTATLRRLTPTSTLASVDASGRGRMFLEAIVGTPGITNRQLASVLGIDEPRVSKLGRRLIEAGFARRTKFGRSNSWEIAARGTQALKQEPLVGGSERTRMRRKFARYIVEMADLRDRESDSSGWLPLAGRVLTTLLASPQPMTPFEIANRTHLSESTVVAAASFLVERGYLRSTDESDPALIDGSTPIAVAAARYGAIGIRILPGKLIGLLSNLDELRATQGLVETVELPDCRESTVLAAIAELVRRLRTPKLGRDLPEYIIGLGIETGGHVDSRSGEVVYSPNLDWRHVELGRKVKELTDLATVVENDVNALAVHEQLVGSATDSDDFAAVLVGNGVGCGLILDGQLIHGRSGVAGEIGHIVVEPDGEECRCGRRGCLETVVSIPAILRRVAATTGDEPGSIDAAAALVDSGNATADVFAHAGNALGKGLATLLNLTNVGRVLIVVPSVLADRSGTPASKVFRAALDQAVKELAFSTAANDCRIDMRHLEREEEYGAHGAASRVVREFLFRPLRWEPQPTVVLYGAPNGSAVEQHERTQSFDGFDLAAESLAGLR